MDKYTISISKAKASLADLINRVVYGGERIILQSRGRPKVAIIRIEDLLRWEQIEAQSAVMAQINWLAQVDALRQQIADRAGRLPDSASLLREMREKRDEENDDLP